MAERHEELPELTNTPRSVREETKKYTELTTSQMSKPTEPVNQWKLLKLIEERKNGMALSDIRWMFQLEDPQDPLIQKPLQSLIKGKKIHGAIGRSERTEKVGVVYSALPSSPTTNPPPQKQNP